MPDGGDHRFRQLQYFQTKGGAKVELETIWSAGYRREIQQISFNPPPAKRPLEEGKEFEETHTLTTKEGVDLKITFHWTGREVDRVGVKEVESSIPKP